MKLPLKWVLIGGFVGMHFIAVTVIQVSAYLSSEGVLVKHARTIMENVSTFIVHESQSYLAPARDAAKLTQQLANSEVVNSDDAATMERYFYEQLQLRDYIAGIYYGKANGEFVYTMRNDKRTIGGYRTKIIKTDDQGRRTTIIWRDAGLQEVATETDPDDTYDPRARPWYAKAQKEAQIIWTDPYIFFTSKKPGLTTASPVYNRPGELKGIVGVDIEIDAISEFLSTLKVGSNGRAFILNQTGEVVAYPDPEKIRAPKPGATEAYRMANIRELDDPVARAAFDAVATDLDTHQLKGPLFSSLTFGGQKYFAMFAPFTDAQWPWVIGLYVPENDYLGPIKANRLTNVYLALAIASLVGLIGYLIARSVSRSMEGFRSEAQAVATYDLSQTFEKDSVIAEIQQTVDAFAQMKTGLSAIRNQNEDLTKDLEKQADALRNNETQLRATFTSLLNFADALFVLDEEKRICFVNPVGEALMGETGAADVGLRFPYPVHSGESREIEIDTGASKPCVAEMSVVDTEWEGAAALLVSLRNISERKAAEASLARSNDVMWVTVAELRRNQQSLRLISRMAELFQVCTTEAEVMKVLLEHMEPMFPVDAGAVFLFDGPKKSITRAHVWGVPDGVSETFPSEQCWGLKKGRAHLVDPKTTGLFCEHIPEDDRHDYVHICVPIANTQGQVGLLYLRERADEGLRPTAENESDGAALDELAGTVADHIALAINNVRLQAELQELAIRDPLTGLYNRRYMEDVLSRELNRAKRSELAVGVIIFDVDRFKRINDTLGHDVGDDVLRRLSDCVTADIRGSDLLCRYGGEEFVLVLLESDYASTLQRAEAIRERIETEVAVRKRGDVQTITISAGVAAFPDHGANVTTLLRLADRALYRAKDLGRNRVCGQKELESVDGKEASA